MFLVVSVLFLVVSVLCLVVSVLCLVVRLFSISIADGFLADYLDGDLVARLFVAKSFPQVIGCFDILIVDADNSVANFNSRFGGRLVGRNPVHSVAIGVKAQAEEGGCAANNHTKIIRQ